MDETSAQRAAHEDLRYIRRTLAAAGHLSTVPGKGLALIGLLALGAVGVNLKLTGAPWDVWQVDRASLVRAGATSAFGVWLLLLGVSLAIGAWTMRQKARRTGQVFWSPVLRKALWGYGAAMLLGGVLTASVMAAGRLDMLPEIWLGCYGVALVTAGGYSVAPVRWMGICFLGLAAVAAWTPTGAGLALLGLGFGWVHIAFGVYIAWRHDG